MLSLGVFCLVRQNCVTGTDERATLTHYFLSLSFFFQHQIFFYGFQKSQSPFPIVILGASLMLRFWMCLFVARSSSLCSLQYYCCFRWFIVCRVKNCFSSDKPNNRSASAAQTQDRLNPTQQSVSKSVSQPLHRLSGQLEKSARQFSVSPASVPLQI